MRTNFLALLDFIDPEKLIKHGGVWFVFLVVFAESGLLVGFFLPGDSLLFTAGMFASGAFGADVQLNIWALLVGTFIAAVAGDQVGYLFGRKVGPALFKREDSKIFKQAHVHKAQEFFDKHGAKALVLARFVPIVRTFCPIVAGVAHMDYPTFLRFNIVGGFLWGVGVTSLGFFLGNIPFVKENFEIAIFAVIAISLLPVAIEIIRSRRHTEKVEI
ncbi:MAG: VTT domain-containing protein [Microthrixaceae bacterium]